MRRNRTLVMLTLVISGEAVFFLPFILPRVFRPTVLEVFQIDNLDLGSMFSAYGIVAMASYFFGGPLADRLPARLLMSGALIATGLGGLFMYTIPSYQWMVILYAFWGMTTILLFWAALIRATREWGDPSIQGKSFGFLEGGRGLAAALISTVGITLLANLIPDTGNVDPQARIFMFKNIVLLFSLVPIAIGIVCYFVIPAGKIKENAGFKGDLEGVIQIIKMPRIWFLSIILVSAYVCFKITDNFSLYAQDVLGFDEVNAAQAGTVALWLRPVVAIIAGFMSDKLLSSRLMIWSFLLLVIGGLAAGSGTLDPTILLPHIFALVCISLGAYSLRVMYYAVLEEARIPLILTGTAVGVISVVGYTPDIFIGPLMGWLLDRSPGPTGHEHVFLVLAGFAVVGFIAGVLFRRSLRASE